MIEILVNGFTSGASRSPRPTRPAQWISRRPSRPQHSARIGDQRSRDRGVVLRRRLVQRDRSTEGPMVAGSWRVRSGEIAVQLWPSSADLNRTLAPCTACWARAGRRAGRGPLEPVATFGRRNDRPESPARGSRCARSRCDDRRGREARVVTAEGHVGRVGKRLDVPRFSRHIVPLRPSIPPGQRLGHTRPELSCCARRRDREMFVVATW